MTLGNARGAQRRGRVRSALFPLALALAALAIAFIAGAAPIVTRASKQAQPPLAAPALVELAAVEPDTSGSVEASALLRPASLEVPAKPNPVVVTMLHGMCSDAEWSCDAVRGATPDGALLTCPAGNGTCGGRLDWIGEGEEKATHLDAVVGAELARQGVEARRDGRDVLMGFSRGAFVARDVAMARPGRYKALVLIGAALEMDPKRLVASGVRRVVLASGDHDHAAKTMRALVPRLVAAGLEARYVSLGPVYHTLPGDTAARLKDALRWAAE